MNDLICDENVCNKKSGKSGIINTILNLKNNLKLKKIKNPKLFILIFALIIVVFAYFKISSSNKSVENTYGQVFYYTNSLDYANALEKKIINVVSKIDGAGSVTAMLTLESSLEIVYAESTNEKNNSTVTGGSTTTSTNSSSETIIIKNNGDNSPLVVKEILPKIKGVVIVCEGAKDVKLKMEIIQAVKALLGIPSDNIQVLY